MAGADGYVQFHDGAWYVGDSRVTVYAVIALWLQGYAPEEIQASFPNLALPAIYGVILYYLEHTEELNASFQAQEALFQRHKAVAEASDPAFYAAMRKRVAAFRASQRPPRTAAAS